MAHVSFWKWFRKGSGRSAGATRLLSLWLVFDITLALSSPFWTPSQTLELAKGVLLPLSGVFVGLAVSWSATAYVLINSEEISRLAEQNEAGLENYVYPFQLAILILLVTITFWTAVTVVAPPQIDFPILVNESHAVGDYFMVFGIFLTSMSLRVAWQVVDLVSTTLLYARKVAALNKNS